MRFKRMAIQVNESSVTVHEKIPQFSVVLSCLVSISWDSSQNFSVLPRWTMELHDNYHYNRYYILKSLLCYRLKIKCIISVPISAALFYLWIFGRKMGLGNLHSFDPGRLPWGQAFEQKKWSEFKSPVYARSPLSPGPPPPSSLTFVFR